MSAFLILLQLVSFHSWAAELAVKASEYQAPQPISANSSISSLRLDPQMDGGAGILSEEDVLLTNDPLLGPAQNDATQDLSQLGANSLRAVSNASPLGVQGIQAKKGRPVIRLNSFAELKRFAVQAVAHPHGQDPAQSEWDTKVSAPTSGAETEPMAGPLFARGPPKITIVRNAAEVGRAIPGTNNFLKHFREELAEKFWRGEIKSLRVYTYTDARGGQIMAVDVSHSPALVEMLPQLHSHEKRLIERLIASGARQVQMALIDGNKHTELATPDLILEGRMAEMKTIHLENFTFFLNKANAQLYAHALRHGLGVGTAVIDLTAENEVPVDAVLRLINGWAKIPVGTQIPSPYSISHPERRAPESLDKIEIFARNDHKVFVRNANGSFGLEKNESRPRD